MNRDLNLGVLAMELQALDTETFEVKDYAEDVGLFFTVCSTSSSGCSCSSIGPIPG